MRGGNLKFSFSLLLRGSTAQGGEWGLGEPMLEVRAEDKLVCTLPYKEEEDRVNEVKCLQGGGACLSEQTSL